MFTNTLTKPTLGRSLAVAVALAALVAGLLLAVQPGSAEASASRTKYVTLTVSLHGCDACDVSLQGKHGTHWWQSHSERARHGKATFEVPQARTRGMTIAVTPGWERHGIPTGYQTLAVARYHGVKAGQRVTQAVARHKSYGNPCWAGTSATHKTLNVAVRKVRVDGTTGRTDGTIAWLNPQTRATGKMMRVYGGILGVQDVVGC